MNYDVGVVKRRRIIAPAEAYYANASGGSSVTPDHVTAAIAFSGTATTYDYTGLTVGAALSGGALIAFGWTNNQNNFSSVIWDPVGANQSLTFIGRVATVAGVGQAELWGLLNPTAGNKILRYTIGVGDRIYACAASFSSVNQGSIALAFPPASFNTNRTVGVGSTDTTMSVVITSAPGHMVVAGANQQAAIGTVTMNQTQIDVNSLGNIGVGCNRALGAGTVTMTINCSAAANLAIAGVDIAP